MSLDCPASVDGELSQPFGVASFIGINIRRSLVRFARHDDCLRLRAIVDVRYLCDDFR